MQRMGLLPSVSVRERLVIGIGAFTAIAFRKRAYAGLELASVLWLLGGVFVLFTLFVASGFSHGYSAMNVRREASLVLPLGAWVSISQ